MNIGLLILIGGMVLAIIGIIMYANGGDRSLTERMGAILIGVAMLICLAGLITWVITANDQRHAACLAMSGQWIDTACYLLLDGKIIQVMP